MLDKGWGMIIMVSMVSKMDSITVLNLKGKNTNTTLYKEGIEYV
jgi:hypothetical protein